MKDGLRLKNVYITASARCAPPGNRPLPSELLNCRGWLEEELELLGPARVYVAVGRIAHESLLRIAGVPLARFAFGHGVVHEVPGLGTVLDTYHVSRQNTNTGRLTAPMFDEILGKAKALATPPVVAFALRASADQASGRTTPPVL